MFAGRARGKRSARAVAVMSAVALVAGGVLGATAGASAAGAATAAASAAAGAAAAGAVAAGAVASAATGTAAMSAAAAAGASAAGAAATADAVATAGAGVGADVGGGYGWCTSGEYVVPAGVEYLRMTVVGERGTDGETWYLPGYTVAPGGGGDAGIVSAVVQVRPGQKLWYAGASALMPVGTPRPGGFSAGGRASFVATVDPQPYCPGGEHPASEYPANAFLAVAGGGGGGGGAGDYDRDAHGGAGGAPGHNGGDGGDNDRQDGAGGGTGTTTQGGNGGAGGHRAGPQTHGDAGSAGSYLTAGTGGLSRVGVGATSGGHGGAGFYGGGGGGGGQNGGSGGGGGGSNYLPPYIPTTAPTSDRPMGTLQNGTTTATTPTVILAPIYPTTTTLTVDPDPAYPDDQITITVHVQSTGGTPATGGLVTLRADGIDVQVAPVTNGTAVIQRGILPPGSTRYTAHYDGLDTENAVFRPSDGSVTHRVTPYVDAPTTTVLTVSPDEIFEYDTPTLTARVADADGTRPEGGRIEFFVEREYHPETRMSLGVVPVGSGAQAGAASVSYPLAAGGWIATAEFSGFTSRTEIFRPNTSARTLFAVHTVEVPVITRNPSSATITYGDEPPVLQADGMSYPEPEVRWQVLPPGDSGRFTDIPGATGTAYQPPGDTLSGTRFRAVVFNRLHSTPTDAAMLTVLPAPLAVTANDVTMGYGTAAPELTARFGTGDEGFRRGDGPGSLGGSLACTSTPAADAALPPGEYPITCSGLTSDRYRIEYRAGTLTVSEAVQSIRVSGAPELARVGEVAYLDAEGGASGQPVVFSSDEASAPWCTVADDGEIDFATPGIDMPFAGTCTVFADQAGSGQYPPAERVTVTIPVEKRAPQIRSIAGRLLATAGQRTEIQVSLDDEGAPQPRYQWYSSRDYGRTWAPVPLAQSPTLLLYPRMAQDSTLFKVLVYNSTGETPSAGRVFSPPAMLHVVPVNVYVIAPSATMVAGETPPVLPPAEYDGDFIGSETPESLGFDARCTVSDPWLASHPGVYDDGMICSGISHPDYQPFYEPATLTVLASPEGSSGGGSGDPDTGSGNGGADGSGSDPAAGAAEVANPATTAPPASLAATGTSRPLSFAVLAFVVLGVGITTARLRRRLATMIEK